MSPLAFKPRRNVLSFHLISLPVRRSQTYPLMSWELWCSWRTMWNTQNCHGRLANFHFNIASSHVLTMVWITRVYVTCTCYESLMSACNFVCTWSYRIMYFSLFQGGWSTCTQFHSWWIQDNTVKIWMKHFKKRSCLCWLCLFALQPAHIFTCHVWRIEVTLSINSCFAFFQLSWVMSLWHHHPKSLAAKWNLNSTVRYISAAVSMK